MLQPQKITFGDMREMGVCVSAWNKDPVFEIAKTGVRDPAKLSALAIKELGVK